MKTVRNLTIWIAATNGDQESITLLKSHYFSGKVRIPDAWFPLLTDSTSEIAHCINAINQAVVSEGIVEDVGHINA